MEKVSEKVLEPVFSIRFQSDFSTVLHVEITYDRNHNLPKKNIFSILHKKSEICVEFVAIYFVLPYTLVHMFDAMYVIAVSKDRVYNWKGDVIFVPYSSN